MVVTNVVSKAASVFAIAAACASAMGQTGTVGGTPRLSFMYSSDKDTWNTLLLISGIVFVVGLADSDSTLEVLGGVGVFLSLYETSSSRFHFGRYSREYDLASSGPFSIGLSSFGRGQNGAFQPIKPCLSYRIRF